MGPKWQGTNGTNKEPCMASAKTKNRENFFKKNETRTSYVELNIYNCKLLISPPETRTVTDYCDHVATGTP